MYSVDDFLKVFNYLKNHPDDSDQKQAEYEVTLETQYNHNLLIQTENNELRRRIEVAKSYQYMAANNPIYTVELMKEQINAISLTMYGYVETATTYTELITGLDEYIIFMSSQIVDLNWEVEPLEDLEFNFHDFTIDLDPEIINIAIETRKETRHYFKRVIDQIAFETDDFNKLRQFIIDWYATLRTFLKIQQTTSNVFALTSELLNIAHSSFGFPNVYKIRERDLKAALLLSLVEMYKHKGAPHVIIQLLNLLGINDVAIYEWWLYRERELTGEDGDLYLQGIKVDQSEDFDDRNFFVNNRFLSYYEFKQIADPHWYYTEEQIKNIDDVIDHLSLPSIMPYFSIVIFMDFHEVQQAGIFINTMCNDLMIKHLQSDLNDDKLIRVPEFGQYVSVLELYCAINYCYDRYNDHIKYEELKYFIKLKYNITPEEYPSDPFIGTYPFRYEKLSHWIKNHKDPITDEYMTLMGFTEYPNRVEIYNDAYYIGQTENVDVNYDNGITHYDQKWLPYILVKKGSRKELISHYNNVQDKVYDYTNGDDYKEIIETEYNTLFKDYPYKYDIIKLYPTFEYLPIDSHGYEIDEIALIVKDFTIQFDQRSPQIYQCVQKTGTREEQWQLVTDEETEEWVYEQYGYLREKYNRNWSRNFELNFSRNRIDPQRILNGNTFTYKYEFRYELPVTNNEAGTEVLVQKDETKGYLPSIYKCVSEIGTIDEQWEYVVDGIYNINLAVNNTIIPFCDSYCASDPELYYTLTDILVSYLNVFLRTYVLEDSINLNELLLGTKSKTYGMINDLKPYRARLLTYEVMMGIDDKTRNRIFTKDLVTPLAVTHLTKLHRETVRNTIDKNYDTGYKHDPPYVYDQLEINVVEDMSQYLLDEEDQIYDNTEPVHDDLQGENNPTGEYVFASEAGLFNWSWNGPNHTWVFPDGFESTLNNPGHTLATPGNVILKVNTVTDILGSYTLNGNGNTPNAQFTGSLEDLPPCNSSIIMYSFAQMTGNISSLNSLNQNLILMNCINIEGDLSIFEVAQPQNIINLKGCSNITGDLSSISHEIYQIDLSNCPLITGDLALLPNVKSYLNLNNCTNISGVFPTWLDSKRIYLNNTNLSEIDVNTILIVLDNKYPTPVSGTAEVDLRNTFAPTGSGLTAKSNLITNGWTILTD